MKPQIIHQPESDKKQANEKLNIDPNWLYILREAERNERRINH